MAKDLSKMARGGNNDQVLLGGLAAGVAEMAFEHFSVDKLLQPKTVTGWRSLLREVCKQGGVEASEEVLTEIANIYADAAIMGEDSHSAIARRRYMLEDHLSEQEQWEAWQDSSRQEEALRPTPGPDGEGIEAPGAQTLPADTRALLMQTAQEIAQRDMARQQREGAFEMQALPADTRALLMQVAQEIAQRDMARQQRAQEERAQTEAARKRRAREQGVRTLAAMAEVFGDNGRKALTEGYDPSQSTDAFFGGFAVYYQAGLTGKTTGQVHSPYARTLNWEQRRAAYNAGQKDAALSRARGTASAMVRAKEGAAAVREEGQREDLNLEKDSSTGQILTGDGSRQFFDDKNAKMEFTEQNIHDTIQSRYMAMGLRKPASYIAVYERGFNRTAKERDAPRRTNFLSALRKRTCLSLGWKLLRSKIPDKGLH